MSTAIKIKVEPRKYTLEQINIAYIKKLLCSLTKLLPNTVQQMRFYMRDFFSKCDQTCSTEDSHLLHDSHLLKKSFMENIFFTVK